MPVRETASRAGRPAHAYALIVRTLDAYVALRDAGRRIGAVSAWGGGTWGLMRQLAEHGPMTVPQIAALRGVTRQRIQQIVDELVADGSVALVDNPRHARSKLVALTDTGRRRYAAVDARVRAAAVEHTRRIPLRDLSAAVRALAALTASLSPADRAEREPCGESR